MSRVRIHAAPSYEPAGPVGVLTRPTASPSPTLPQPVRPPMPRTGRTGVPARKMAAAAAEARRFTVTSTRLVFEVIDRRRGAHQLADVAAPAVVDQVAALVRHDAFRAPDAAGTSVQRVHVQLCDISAAEVFGSYVIGGRVRAFAGRIERKPVRVRSRSTPGARSLGQAEYRWQLVALEFT